jgi:TatD-related deoxyribonuclease
MFLFDNHLHLQPGGRCVGAIKDFEKFGGTHVMLCHTPYYEFSGEAPGNYEKDYETTLQLLKRTGRDERQGFCLLGP